MLNLNLYLELVHNALRNIIEKVFLSYSKGIFSHITCQIDTISIDEILKKISGYCLYLSHIYKWRPKAGLPDFKRKPFDASMIVHFRAIKRPDY